MATITGTLGNDTLLGTDPDPFFGTGGDDTIDGLAGDDVIDGRGGVNLLFGGTGDDTFRFTYDGAAPTTGTPSQIDGGEGYDTLDFSGYGHAVSIGLVYPGEQGGSPGDLSITTSGSHAIATGIERVIGSAHANTMSFSAAVEAFGAGDVDTLVAAGGAILHGLGGNDSISAGDGGTGYGGSGSDSLKLTGLGQLYGEDGDDVASLGTDANHEGPTVSGGLIDGGDSIDTFRGYFGDAIDLQAGTLVHNVNGVNGTTIAISVLNFENVLYNGGSSGQWSVYGTEGANILDARGSVFNVPEMAVRFYGRGGDDTLYGSDGIDILDGGTGNDVLAGDANNNILIGGSGIDTAVLRYAFATYSFSFLPGRIEVTGTSEPNADSLYGPGKEGINRLYGIERIQFSDGVINRADGAPLVDDIYYLANNHDVFVADADADDHYAQFGWHEGRDPNALFGTLAYLGANRDVAAAKVNPLDHYLAYGAREGRDPSAAFDSEQYLARNPDVAASGVNPLQHYLEYGQAEGRAIYAAVGKQLIGDFDPEYYLLTNPDVAAAGVDPLKHYEQYGWHEGRDPNAYFDTSYYLANNADVAAAGIDPLAHYEMYGWRELRDPSASFDTSVYLAAAPDVAAAGIDPLSHYLAYGRLEGRTIDADPSGTAPDDWLI